MPVGLPTADDLVVISDSVSSDIEAGGELAMREIGHALPAIQKTPVPQPEKLPSPLPPPPASPNQTPTRALSDPLESAAPVSDLLADSSGSLASVALQPLVAAPEESPSSPTSDDSAVLVDDTDASPPSMHSIRLVGEGGAEGAVSEPASSDGVLVSEPEEVPEPVPAPKDSLERGRHEKKKSISSGLKKIGGIGGSKGRTESVSSAKSVKQ